MAISILYWINPKGKILKQHNVTHIKQVTNNPKIFGVTRKWIESIYSKYDEPVGAEGDAREEIMKFLFKKGYIRIRLYINKFWSVTLYGFNRKAKKSLSVWAKDAKDDKFSGLYMPVKILDLKSDKLINRYDVNDISHDEHIYESDKLSDDEFLPEFITEIEKLSTKPILKFKKFSNE